MGDGSQRTETVNSFTVGEGLVARNLLGVLFENR